MGKLILIILLLGVLLVLIFMPDLVKPLVLGVVDSLMGLFKSLGSVAGSLKNLGNI